MSYIQAHCLVGQEVFGDVIEATGGKLYLALLVTSDLLRLSSVFWDGSTSLRWRHLQLTCSTLSLTWYRITVGTLDCPMRTILPMA